MRAPASQLRCMESRVIVAMSALYGMFTSPYIVRNRTCVANA